MLKVQTTLRPRQHQSVDKELLRKDPTVRPFDAGEGEERMILVMRGKWTRQDIYDFEDNINMHKFRIQGKFVKVVEEKNA